MNKLSIEISLEQLKHILRILHIYPKEMELIGFKDLVKPNEVHSVHKAWCDLYSKYDGNEKPHFSTSWSPFLFSGYVIVDGRKCSGYYSNGNSKRALVDCKWEDGTHSRIMLTNDSEYNYAISVMSETMIEIYELDL